MTLIDTSSWIHSLRPDGDPEIVTRVRRLLENGEAAWCPLVQLELWNGARGAQEQRVLAEMRVVLPNLPIDEAVWDTANELARVARSYGHTVPSTDLIITACARNHHADLEHDDAHMAAIQSMA